MIKLWAAVAPENDFIWQLTDRNPSKLFSNTLFVVIFIMASKRKTQQTLNNWVRPKLAKKGKSMDSEECDVLLKYGLQWQQIGDEVLTGIKSLLYLNFDQERNSRFKKVAGFDIDSTIITTKSGKTFAANITDWKWLLDFIPTRLHELHNDGFQLVFFTNQLGLEKKKVTLIDVQTKILDILNKLDLPILVFAATGMNHYRKPCTEMWNFFLESCNQEVNLENCFYVGDAAGRLKNWAPNKKKDFSCADRMFAANIGIKFYTPEEYFCKEKVAKYEWPSIDAKSLIIRQNNLTSLPSYHSKTQELAIMVGMPASGKSTFCKDFFEPFGYVIVNRDNLNTQAKCIKVAEEALGTSKSVIIDNTNPSKKDRAFYVGLAKKIGIPARCFYINTDERVAHHLNIVRQNMTKGKIRRIPPVVYNVFKKNLEKPVKNEGFSEVVEIGFLPNVKTEEFKKYFLQWTE